MPAVMSPVVLSVTSLAMSPVSDQCEVSVNSNSVINSSFPPIPYCFIIVGLCLVACRVT